MISQNLEILPQDEEKEEEENDEEGNKEEGKGWRRRRRVHFMKDKEKN